MTAPILELRHVTKTFGEKVILDIPHLMFEQGRVCAIMGPNGAGKSTLISILACLDYPSTGSLWWKGSQVNGRARELLRKQVTLITQTPYLFHTTVSRNVDYGLRIRGLKRSIREVKVRESLSLVGLDGFQKRHAYELSGGEIQRAAIARALVLEPEVLLLDEPTANIDQRGVQQLDDILQTLNRDMGITIVMASHDVNQVYRISDEVIPLFEGRIRENGPIDNIFKGKVVAKTPDCYIFNTGHIEVEILPVPHEVRHIAIHPEHIIVSRESIVTSARNAFSGAIVGISESGNSVILNVNVGEVMRAKITKRSFHELRLTIGSRVHITFKSSAVEILE